MKSLQSNDWIFINDLIYKINSCTDQRSLQEIFLSQISNLIPYDTATFYLSCDFSENSNPVCVNADPSALAAYSKHMNQDYTKWMFTLSKSMILRESDYWTDEERESTEYYKAVYDPADVHFALVVTLIHQGTFIASCNFYNSKKSGDFSDKIILIMNQLKHHLSLALYKLMEKEACRFDSSPRSLINRFHFTKKESEILDGILTGHSTDILCNNLFISPHTLKNHLQNIYRKAGVKNKTELLLKSKFL